MLYKRSNAGEEILSSFGGVPAEHTYTTIVLNMTNTVSGRPVDESMARCLHFINHSLAYRLGRDLLQNTVPSA